MSAQAMRALERANTVRLAKARLKRQVKNGERTFRSVLDELPECCANMTAFDVLQWCPQVGHERARKLTRGVVSETLPLRFVRGHIRDELLEQLQTRGVQ
jgi:hypothetical protein